MALQQPLRDASRKPEVPINLERRVRVEQVRVRAAVEELEDVVRQRGAVQQARGPVDRPGARPAGARAAVLQAVVEGLARGGPEGRVVAWGVGRGDLGPRVERVEVRDVPVAGLGFGVVVQPLLEDAGVAGGDFGRGEAGHCGVHGGEEGGVYGWVGGEGGDGVLVAGEELAEDLEVAGRADGHAAGGVGGGVVGVFGGGGGVGDEVGRAVHLVGLESVEVELDCAGQGGEFLLQEGLVAAVEVVLEDVRAEPGRGEGPV